MLASVQRLRILSKKPNLPENVAVCVSIGDLFVSKASDRSLSQLSTMIGTSLGWVTLLHIVDLNGACN